MRLHGLGADSFDSQEAAQVHAADRSSRLSAQAPTAALRASRAPTVCAVPTLLTKLMLRWSYGELVVRLPSALAGAATVWAVWHLGVALIGAEAALYAAALLAFSPMHVALSRTVGSDAWLTFLTLLAVIVFCQAVRYARELSRWMVFAGVGALAGLSGYAALLGLIGLGVWSIAMVVRDRATSPVAVRACLAIALAATPAGVWALYNPPHSTASFVQAPMDWSSFVDVASALATGELDRTIVGLVLLACALLGAVCAVRYDFRSGMLVSWLVIGVSGTVDADRLLQLGFGAAQIVFTLPGYLLLAGNGLSVIRRVATSKTSVPVGRTGQTVLLSLLLVVELPALRHSLQQRRPAWRDAAATVARNAHDDAIVAWLDWESFLFYAPDLERRVELAVRPRVVVAHFVHPQRSWLIAPTAARLHPGWKRLDNLFARVSSINLSPGPGIEVFYTGNVDRYQLLIEAAYFELPTATLVRGDLLFHLLREIGPAPPLLWKVDQIALSRQPFSLRNPELLNVVYYLAEHGHGDRAASLAYRMATAEPNWGEAQQALAAFLPRTAPDSVATPAATSATAGVDF